MEPGSLSLFQAILLAFTVSALGFVSQVAFRIFEFIHRRRKDLRDLIVAEFSIAEALHYRLRILCAEIFIDRESKSNREIEEFLFDEVLENSRTISLGLDLAARDVLNSDSFIRSLHYNRKSCIDYVLERIESNEYCESHLRQFSKNELSHLRREASFLIKRIG